MNWHPIGSTHRSVRSKSSFELDKNLIAVYALSLSKAACSCAALAWDAKTKLVLTGMNTTPDSTSDKLTDAKGLLEALWEAEARPSVRWLRTQQKKRTIPFVRIGRRIFFSPTAVLAALRKLNHQA